MTDYFHRRNRPDTEYSGHEDLSSELRYRLRVAYRRWVVEASDESKLYIPKKRMEYALRHQFPRLNPDDVTKGGSYDQIFTVVEMMFDMGRRLNERKWREMKAELSEAFRLSGSVYKVEEGEVRLSVSEDLAAKISTAEEILAPHDKAFKAFFAAVGDLMGRRAKPADVVKDLFVGAEAYLKAVTGENDFGNAVKKLAKEGTINVHQKGVMERLYSYRSDSDGTAHSGNAPTPTESDALWFLESMLAQITLVDRIKKGSASRPS